MISAIIGILVHRDGGRRVHLNGIAQRIIRPAGVADRGRAGAVLDPWCGGKLSRPALIRHFGDAAVRRVDRISDRGDHRLLDGRPVIARFRRISSSRDGVATLTPLYGYGLQFLAKIAAPKDNRALPALLSLYQAAGFLQISIALLNRGENRGHRGNGVGHETGWIILSSTTGQRAGENQITMVDKGEDCADNNRNIAERFATLRLKNTDAANLKSNIELTRRHHVPESLSEPSRPPRNVNYSNRSCKRNGPTC